MDWTPHDLDPVQWLPLVIYALLLTVLVVIFITIRVIT